MTRSGKVATVVGIILVQVTASYCLSFCPKTPSETLRNVVVAGNDVIVGSTSALYRLTLNLLEVESVTLPMNRPNQLLVADGSTGGWFGGAVLACGFPRCTLSPTDALSNIIWEGAALYPAGETNVLGVFSLSYNGTLSITFGRRDTQSRPSTITRGSLMNSFRSPPYTFVEYAQQSEPNTVVTREFLAVFSHQDYQYFVVQINRDVRIIRLCQRDNGIQPSPSSSFTSHFELRLRCASSDTATAATFVNSIELFGVETVLLSLDAPTSVYVCAFNLSEINERMDQKMETCLNGTGNVGFGRDQQAPCPTLLREQIAAMNITTCNLPGQFLLGLRVDTLIVELVPLLTLELSGTVRSMTYTKHLTDGSHYLLMGTSRGSLLQAEVVNSSHAKLVRTIRLVSNTMDLNDDITQLVPSEDGDYVYALTTQQLLQQPVDLNEMISSNNCGPPLPTPVESPQATSTQQTDPQASVTVIASSVAAGVVGAFIITVMVIAIVALSIGVSFKQYKKTKQELTGNPCTVCTSQVEFHEVEEDQRYISNTIADRIGDGIEQLTGCIEKLPLELVLPSNQIQLFESIGQGEFGIVYKAHLLHQYGHGPPKIVAVKTLKGLFTVNDVHNMTDEILKMKHFDHPHVMTLVGVCVSVGGGPAIVMPFMANGSLLNYLRKDKLNLIIRDDQDLETLGAVQKLLLGLCLQVAKGMEYLALHKFVHRDLAARNCMIDSSGVIKVADFGLSEDMYSSGYFRQDKLGSVKLPFKWMPLESLQEGLFSQKSDVWSFGVTCWEVFTAGKIPYAGADPLTLIQLLENGRRLDKPTNAACSEEIYSAVEKCWEREPDNRPKFSELVSTISSILQTVAGYLELSMPLQPDKSEFQGSTTTADDSKPGKDANDLALHQTDSL